MSSRDDLGPMQDFVATFGLEDFPHIADLDGSVWARYEVTTQPAFAFVDDDGTVDVHIGTLGESGLAERLDELIES